MRRLILVVGGVLLLVGLSITLRFICFQQQLKEVYSKQCLIKNKMSLTQVYKLLDTRIKPKTYIRHNQRDSIYEHTINFSPLWNSETTLSVEFNPYTFEVINYPECDL